MGKINTDNYPNRPFASYQDDDMFILQDNGGETYTTNVGDIKNLADSRIKLEGVQVNGTDLPITNKKVNVDISGKTDLRVIAFPFHDPVEGEPSMGFFKGAYVTYNGKLYEFTQEHQGAWNPSHVREINAAGWYVRVGNGGYNSGDYATTEGHSTRAEGEAAHAEGTGTIANSDNQHAGGRYNVADPDDTYVRIIGNGTGDNARSNALTLDWDGNLTVSGEVEDGNGEKLSDKADKVTNATSGHLAGLDSNGNLTDSGVSPTEDVTVEGNPVTFDSPFEQDAKSVVVSVKPIQDLHGYDHPWVGGAEKNKSSINDCNTSASTDLTTQPISIGSERNYTISMKLMRINGVTVDNPNLYAFRVNEYDSTDTIINTINSNIQYLPDNIEVSFSQTVTLDSNAAYIIITYGNFNGDTNINTHKYDIQVEEGSTATSFAPYSNICPISGIDEVEIEVSDGESEPTTTTIPLPSALYDADVDVTNGDADSRKEFVEFDGTDSTGWELKGTYGTSVRFDYSGLSLEAAIGSETSISNYLILGIIGTNDLECFNFHAINKNLQVQIHADRLASNDVSGLMGFFASNPLQVCYELATPTTISFTPADVELLEGTNVVSTNGEKVAVTYGRSLWQDISDLKTDTEGKLDKSDVADIEGDTASRPYSVNEFMLRADGLYKVTQPIAQNASITASNTTKTTVGEVLTALLNA